MIIKRNLLCLKARENLDLSQILIYEPYKIILIKLNELCISISNIDFDLVTKCYTKLLSIPYDINEYYESLLEIISYYSSRQFGKENYIQKRLASSFETCSPSIELSKLPFWLEYPYIYRKKGLFTQQGLSSDEKRIFRTSEWDWIGTTDPTTDVGSLILDEKSLVLVEIKNRVDSGGAGSRREIWKTDKFGAYIEYLNSNVNIFRRKEEEYSLSELLENFGIENLQMFIGILFDRSENPATIMNDKTNGFYSSSKEGYGYLLTQINQNTTIKIIDKDDINLQMNLALTYSDLKVTVGTLYGNDVTLKLFGRDFPVSDLLLLKYDDMWLSQLTTIDERAILLKNNSNYTSLFLNLLKKDIILRGKYDALIISECLETNLNAILKYTFERHSGVFEDVLLPIGREKEGYLADIIQFLCACDA